LIELEFGNVGFSGEKKTVVLGEKPTTNSSHMTQGRNRTQATLVGGKHSHCANPAPLNFPFKCNVQSGFVREQTKATDKIENQLDSGISNYRIVKMIN